MRLPAVEERTVTIVDAARAARASLWGIGLAWTLPFVLPYRSFALPSFYSEWTAFAGGLAAATLLLHPHVRQGLRIPLIAMVPLGLLAVILLQLLAGRIPYTEQGLIAALYLLWVCTLILLGGALQRELGTEAIARPLAWCLVFGGSIAAAWALLTHYEAVIALGPIVINFRSKLSTVYGHVGQPNHFADYLALSLCSLAYLVADRKLSAIPAIPIGVILLWVMALTGSRSAWIYCLALLVLSLWWYRRNPGSPSTRLVVCAAFIMLGFGMMHWVATLPFMNPERAVVSGRRLFELVHGGSPRIQLWLEAWSAFLEAPLLGVGFGQFAWHHFQSATHAGWTGMGLTHHAHNILMHLLAETGLAGALIVVAGVTAWLVGLKRLEAGLHSWWIIALLLVMAIHSQFEFPLWYANFLGIAALLLGVGSSQYVGVGRQAPRLSTLAVTLAMGWFVAMTTLGSYRSFEELLFASGDGKSTVLPGPEFTVELMKVQSESLLTPYVELAVALAIKPDATNLADKLDLNTRVMRFLPASPVVYQQAMLLMLRGEKNAALGQLRHAVAAYPNDMDEFAKELAVAARQSPDVFSPLLQFIHAHRQGGADMEPKR